MNMGMQMPMNMGMPMGMNPMQLPNMLSPMGNRGPISMNLNFSPNGNPPLFNPGPMNLNPSPLFPIGMGLSQPNAQNIPNAQATQSVLVYSDDDISMEEKRAELLKYRINHFQAQKAY